MKEQERNRFNMDSKRKGPFVSVIIPCYNYGRFLKECIESVLTQTAQGIEIIVVNDGSIDETEAVCKSFGEEIRYQVQPHVGLVNVLNVGIEMSRGDFLYFLSADDKLFPETIERQLKVMEEDETCAVVCGNGKMIDERGRCIGDNIIPFPQENRLLKMLGSPNLHDGSLLFRKVSMEKINALYFDPSLGDYHIYHFKCFLLARKFKIQYLNEFLVYQRVHSFNLSHPKHLKKMIAGYEVLRKEMRKHVTIFDLFEKMGRENREETAQAYYKLGTLFFLFGQYEIAYDDLKSAFVLMNDIFEREVNISELNIGQYVFPLPIKNIQVQDKKAWKAAEREKELWASEVIQYLNRGNILKAFFVCREKLKKEPNNIEAKYLLAKVYLRQLQFHDSANRFHEITLRLLQEIQEESPFHSIDLYLWLSFLDEERKEEYFNELLRRRERIQLYDVKEMLWAINNAKAMGMFEWIERGVNVLNRLGIPLDPVKETNPVPMERSLKKRRNGRGRILFINPPYRRFLGLGAPCFPLSFGHMATMLEEQGYDVGIYDAEYERRFVGKTETYEYTLMHQSKITEALKDKDHYVWAEIKRRIEAFDPNLVGITAMTNKYPIVERIAEIAKSLDQSLPVVIGGHHPTLYGDKLIRNRNIDFAVRGEGEMTMVEMVQQFFKGGKDFSEVKGLIYKEGCETHTNPTRERIKSLDLLPIPNRDLMTNEDYISGNDVMTGRGCPFQCSYCGAKLMWGRQVRRRSVDKVLEEINGMIRRTGSRAISFWDDSFTCDREYLRELVKGLQRIDGLTFNCITRLDLVDREVLQLLKQAGCQQIMFGIESGSERILKLIQKGMNRDFIKKKVDEVHSFGIPWLGFFILGYPGETGEEMVETLRFMKELDPPYAEINIFNPLPGTPVWDALEKEGRVNCEMDFSRYSQSSLENYFVSDMNQETFRELAIRIARAFDEHNRRKQEGAKRVAGNKETVPSIGVKRKGDNSASIPMISTPGFTKAFPIQAHFLMIDKCNAKCIFCGGNYFYSQTNRRITLQKFQKMATNLKLECIQKIVLAGAGDPLLNPDLISIIQYTNQRYPNVLVSITTNGIALTEEMAEALLRCKISDLNVSINAATRNVYKRMMQVDCFEKVCRNVERLVALRRKKGTGPVLQFSSAINRLNIEDLPALVELGKGIGIDSINIFYTRFYPERIRHLNVDREEDRLNNQDSLFYYQDLSDQMVEKAKLLAGKYGIQFFHEPLFKELIIPQPCVWPETQLMVGFDGEIYPCGGAEIHFKGKVEGGIYHFGNALSQTIEAFWNGEMYRLLRISSEGGEDCPLPECKVCANRMNPREEKAHIMQWDAPEIAAYKETRKQIDIISERGAEKEHPLVSVIVPTYNRPDMLMEAIKSILNQTYPNYEVIVVNDAGVDVEKMITPLDPSGRITYVRHGKNQGLAAARNTGIKTAKGKYIAYLDDDDIYYPNHLETLVNFLEGSDYKVAYTDAYRSHQKKVGERYVVERRDLPYSFDFDYDRILLENFIPVLCVIHEKSCLGEAGLFDENLTTLEDWDLWIRMSRKFKFGHIPKVTCEFSWREDGSSMTSGKKIHFFRNQKRIYEKYRCFSKDKPELNHLQETFLKKMNEMVNQEYDRIQQLISTHLIEEAVSGLERLLILSPSHSLANNDLGVLYFMKGETEKALEKLEKAYQIDPNHLDIMKNLADVYVKQGNFDKSFEIYEKILSQCPKDLEAYKALACLFTDLDRKEEALFWWKKVLEIDLNDSVAKEYIGKFAKEENQEIQNIEGDAQFAHPMVSIIIPVFNNLALTQNCLASIIKNTKEINYEIIVVDNGSTDGAKEYLQGMKINTIRPFFLNKNKGFAVACNCGAKNAKGKYVLFLNNDTEVTSGWLEALISIFEKDEKVAAVGSKLLFPDGTIQHAGVVIIDDRKLPDPLVARHIYYKYRSHFSEANVKREYQALTAACLLIRKDVFDEVRGFDEGYWNGYEDIDLCFKLREKGWKLIYQPESVVVHLESKSGQERFNKTRENISLLHKKWLGKVKPDLIIEKDGSVHRGQAFSTIPYLSSSKENISRREKVTSIIIPVYNQLQYTRKCLESIFEHTDIPFELIIVDNGSTDDTLIYLERIKSGKESIGRWRLKGGDDKETVEKMFLCKESKKKKKIKKDSLCRGMKIISNERNLGFAASNNKGVKEAKGDYLLLLNNDVVVTPGWLKRMIDLAERKPEIGLVGPMSNYVTGPQLVKEVAYGLNDLVHLYRFAQDFANKNQGKAKPFWGVIGFCMLIKREVLEKIGGLDERYGLGNLEDIDYCIRARLAGFESWIAEDCFVHHFGSRTFSGSGIDYQESLNRNWEIFKKKWGIPPEIEYGAPFDLSEILSQGFDPVRHYCPLTPEEYSLSRGEELFQAGDVEGAKLLFNRLVQENPDEVDLLNNLGVIAYQEGEFDQAMTYLNRVLTLNPDHPDALENLGHCLIAKGAYREAVQYFERALELKPGDLSLLNSLGNCLIQTGDFLRAEEIYQRSYQIDETQMKVREILAGLERLKSMETERRAVL